MISNIASGEALKSSDVPKKEQSRVTEYTMALINNVLRGEPLTAFAPSVHVLDILERLHTGKSISVLLAPADEADDDGASDIESDKASDKAQIPAGYLINRVLLFVCNKSMQNLLQQLVVGDPLRIALDSEESVDQHPLTKISNAFRLLSPSPEDWRIQRTRLVTDLRLNPGVQREHLLYALTEFVRYVNEVDSLFALVKQPKLQDAEKQLVWSYFSGANQELSKMVGEYHRARATRDRPQVGERDRDLIDYNGEMEFIRYTLLQEQSLADIMRITSAPSAAPVYQAQIATENGRNPTNQRSGHTAGRGAGRTSRRNNQIQGNRNNPGRGNATEKVGGRKSSPEFNHWCKLNPDTCYKCEDKGHLGRDCKHPKPLNALARDNPHRLRQESVSRGSNGVYVTAPLRAFTVQAMPQVQKIILDSGASGGAYVSSDAGFDRRTIVQFSVGQPVTGVGAGGTVATYGGTVYIAVPAHRIVNGKKSVEEMVLWFGTTPPFSSILVCTIACTPPS